MISFTNTITIDRPAEEVYAYLTDLEHIPEWNWAITKTRKISEGPVTAGTRYEQTRHTPTTAVEQIVIIDLEPDRHLHIEGTLGPFHADLRYDIEPVGDQTHLTNQVALHGDIPTLKLALARLSIPRAVASNLNALKTRLEQPSIGATDLTGVAEKRETDVPTKLTRPRVLQTAVQPRRDRDRVTQTQPGPRTKPDPSQVRLFRALEG